MRYFQISFESCLHRLHILGHSMSFFCMIKIELSREISYYVKHYFGTLLSITMTSFRYVFDIPVHKQTRKGTWWSRKSAWWTRKGAWWSRKGVLDEEGRVKRLIECCITCMYISSQCFMKPLFYISFASNLLSEETPLKRLIELLFYVPYRSCQSCYFYPLNTGLPLTGSYILMNSRHL